MKYLFLVLSLIASNTFAMQLNCAKKVTDIRTESTNVRSWPHLFITRGFQECEEYNGMSACHAGVLENIASEYSVCFQNFEVKADCSVTESGDFLSGLELNVQCNETSLNFTMDTNKLGKATCFVNGTPKKTWSLGTCKEE